MAVKANDVKTLRDMTSAGMMDCKKALEETGGDLQKAVNLLRERGIAKAAKRGGRATKEGLVVAKSSDDRKSAALVALTCETDFVARGEEFVALANKLADAALSSKTASAAALREHQLDGKSVDAAVQEKIGTVGENMVIANAECLTANGSGGFLESYIHPPGKIGVLLAVQAEGDAASKPALRELAQDICMHIAAESPRFLNASDVDKATLDSEREIYRNKAVNEGKPANILDRVVEGAVKKFYQDNCLLEQDFVVKPGTSVGKLLEQKSKELGGKIQIAAFRRFAIGESAEQAEEGAES